MVTLAYSHASWPQLMPTSADIGLDSDQRVVQAMHNAVAPDRTSAHLCPAGFAGSENGFQSDKSFKTGHTFSNNGETWIEVRVCSTPRQ